jgi:hypothetical protein
VGEDINRRFFVEVVSFSKEQKDLQAGNELLVQRVQTTQGISRTRHVLTYFFELSPSFIQNEEARNPNRTYLRMQ